MIATDDTHSVAKPLTNLKPAVFKLKPAVSAISETGGFNPVKPAVSVSETTGQKVREILKPPEKASVKRYGDIITYDIVNAMPMGAHQPFICFNLSGLY